MQEDPPSQGQDRDRLDSWKEIAAYLGKDVRTAIRWSKNGGMPVYRHAEGKRGAVYAYRSELDDWIRADRPDSFRPAKTSPSRKTVFRLGASFALISIAIAVLLFLRPSSLTEGPNIQVEQRPWVLITDFDNRSGEARFEGTLETALRRELANSPHVLVVARERVRDTLALMKLEPEAKIDVSLGREICLRLTEIRALLTGRLERFGSAYLLGLEVMDPTDGRTVASAAEEADGEAEMLPAIHRLGDWLRQHLGEELAQISPQHGELEEVTTPSLHALELYSKGRQLESLEPAQAESLFRQAIEEDPEFASAHMWVFWMLYHQGKGSEEEARGFLERAMELASSTSDRERFFIEGTYYDHFERNQQKACWSYKTLADLFPDHFFGAGNATHVCGRRLGQRESHVRYAVQAAKQRGLSWTLEAADALSLIEGDFDRARPYIEQLKEYIEEGDVLWAIPKVELFLAEEYLDRKLLPEVLYELRRVELALGSMDPSRRDGVARKLVYFYLSLGRLQKAQLLAAETENPGLHQSWCAFLAGDEAVFLKSIEGYLTSLERGQPDPSRRLIQLLGWNMPGMLSELPPLDVLAPLYDPGSALERVAGAGMPPPLFLSLPAFEAKLRLARARSMLHQGFPGEAIPLLRRSLNWLRYNGDWEIFSYYFLAAELLAVANTERGNLRAAYRVLEKAAGARRLVCSYSAPMYHRVQARLALVARELGRTAEAEVIEAELEAALSLADQDHPILVQIRDQRAVSVSIE